MPLLFIDYTNMVLKAFDERRVANQLSQLLIHPTTANIKQECFNVYSERIERGEPEEENTLRTFFGVPPAGKNFGYLIKRCKADRFRPLQSLIKKEIKNPGIANVELLAWLIDFTPRPLARAQNPINAITSQTANSNQGEHTVRDRQEVLLTTTIVNTGDPSQDEMVEISAIEKKDAENLSQRSKHKKAIAIFLIVVMCVAGLYATWQHEQRKQMKLGNTNNGCMYWAEDHYEAMHCNEERKDRLILPINMEKMKNFKKILKEDTITEKSIGRIYYIKIDGRIEYYTTSGNHPIDVTRPLKPLSEYMFDMYLRKQGSDQK